MVSLRAKNRISLRLRTDEPQLKISGSYNRKEKVGINVKQFSGLRAGCYRQKEGAI